MPSSIAFLLTGFRHRRTRRGRTLIYSQRFFESPTAFAYIVVMLAVGLVVASVPITSNDPG